MNLKYTVRNEENVRELLKSVPRGGLRVVLFAITEYLIGNMQHGLMHYQRYKYITRKEAYGYTFKSEKQRRYVMAKIRSGEIDPGAPHRTGNTQRAWTMVETERGYNIVNPTKGAMYTRSDKYQARLNGLAGWLKQADVIAGNIKGALRAGRAALREWLSTR